MNVDYTNPVAVAEALAAAKVAAEAASVARQAAQVAVDENDSISAAKSLKEASGRANHEARLRTNTVNVLERALDTLEEYAGYDLAPNPVGESVAFSNGELSVTDSGHYEGGAHIDREHAAKLVAALTEYFSL